MHACAHVCGLPPFGLLVLNAHRPVHFLRHFDVPFPGPWEPPTPLCLARPGFAPSCLCLSPMTVGPAAGNEPPRGDPEPHPLTSGVAESCDETLMSPTAGPRIYFVTSRPPLVITSSVLVCVLFLSPQQAPRERKRPGYSHDQEQRVVRGLGEGGRLEDLKGQAWAETGGRAAREGPRGWAEAGLRPARGSGEVGPPHAGRAPIFMCDSGSLRGLGRVTQHL